MTINDLNKLKPKLAYFVLSYFDDINSRLSGTRHVSLVLWDPSDDWLSSLLSWFEWVSSHWEGTPADVDGQFFVEADDSAISADASTFSVCLGVIFAEFSDANACWRKSTSIFLLDFVFF